MFKTSENCYFMKGLARRNLHAEKILTQTMMVYLFFRDLRYILHRSELCWVEIFKKFAQDSERFAQLFFLQSDCRIYNQIVDFFEPTIVEIYNEIVEKKRSGLSTFWTKI